jgi:hypothetical protein
MNMEQWWNDVDRGKLKNLGENLSHFHSVHHKSHWTDMSANPGCHWEKLATNYLSYGTATIKTIYTSKDATMQQSTRV